MSSKDDDTKGSAITHINELPSEVLAHIFSACDYEKDNCAVLLDLACVCKQWRDVIWAFPRFWTSQLLSVPMKLKNDGPDGVLLPKLCNHLEKWYGRAGDVPRDLSLSFKKAGSKTHVLYKYFTGGTRWRALSFSFELEGASNWGWLEGLICAAHNTSKIPSPQTGEPQPCWPDLTHLELLTPFIRYDPGRLDLPLEHIAPNLTHLKVHVCELRTSVFSIFASSPNAFANLTTFDWKGALGTESLAFYVHLLSTAPKLEVFRALDEQHDFDVAKSLPEQYAKVVPLRHEVLREVVMHWSPNAGVLLKSVALPKLQTLDLARSYDPSHIARPSDDETPLANAVKALVLHSTKAAAETGVDFALKSLKLSRNPLVLKDLWEVVMAVKDTVEELVLDRAACWWDNLDDLFVRLDDLVKGNGDAEASATQEREAAPQLAGNENDMDLRHFFPHLKVFTIVPKPYLELTFTATRMEEDEFATFTSSPLSWWDRHKVRIDVAEEEMSGDDESPWYDSDRDDYWDGGFDEDDMDGEWEDEEDEEDIDGDEDEDDGEDEDEDDGPVGTWQLATMTLAPHPHYED
ncbi:hypothetical protein NMY22_g18451 [Coprinellus aureogranulatus]|nr:hypothetical protein NMY22_g18451 [Coprinellus aureogranulatus]